MLVLAFVVSRAARTRHDEVTQEEAVATATEQVEFVPEDTQVRLPAPGDRPASVLGRLALDPDGPATAQTYADLAVVRIDARAGEIVEFTRAEGRRGSEAPDQAP